MNESDQEQDITDNSESVIVIVEGKGNNVLRPARLNIPRFWPKDLPLPERERPSSEPKKD